jgi:hypothetical protein
MSASPPKGPVANQEAESTDVKVITDRSETANQPVSAAALRIFVATDP